MSGKSSIPPWQRTHDTTTPSATSDPEDASPAPATPTPPNDAAPEPQTHDAPLIAQASAFLDDPEVRDAPREKKVEFLRSKGVEADDIEALLESHAEDDDSHIIVEAGERAWSTAPPKPSTSPAPQSQARDIPPIVTYPEFLAQPAQQPPLITTQRLLNTAYIVGGFAATLYGLSKYIVAPMTRNLTDSRHEFALHAQEHLEKLNERLKDNVSVDPAAKAKILSTVADDVSEADSDPTELYHRDFGTQTTPTLSRRPSMSSSTDEQSAVQAHQSRLGRLTSHLRELELTQIMDSASSSSLQTKISDLTTYLNEMSYQNQYYSGMGGFYGGSYGQSKPKDGQVDQIDVLKNDIRAVKGVFLSARNFPAGGRSPQPIGSVGG